MTGLNKIKELSAQELAGKFLASNSEDYKKFFLIYSLARKDDSYNQFDTFVHNPYLFDASNNYDSYEYSEK